MGGGYIAAEFSHIAALAGAKVTVLQHGDRMLKNFDADLVGWLMEKFHALGIDVQTSISVTGIEKAGTGYRCGLRRRTECRAESMRIWSSMRRTGRRILTDCDWKRLGSTSGTAASS